MYVLMILGLIQVTLFACGLISFIYRHTLKCRKNFKQRYNQGDSWAVVTGGSDGIGEQFCYDLAQSGFNICIISRNAEKINQKLKQIQDSLPEGKKIKTRCVVADFGKMSKYEEYSKVAAQVADIDIGMLILNAGSLTISKFSILSP